MFVRFITFADIINSPHIRPHLPPLPRHVHHRRDEGAHGRSYAQLAGARRALHLRLFGRENTRPRRHRHGPPNRQLQLYTACAAVPPDCMLPVLGVPGEILIFVTVAVSIKRVVAYGSTRKARIIRLQTIMNENLLA